MANYANEQLGQAVGIAAALADGGRVRILHALQGGELCVCQLVELLGLAPSTVSRHLSLLRQAGLLETRRDGRWIHYRLAPRPRGSVVAQALGWSLKHAGADPQLRDDARRLVAIRSQDLSGICGPAK